ncbi:hypothetical protein GCM10011514_44770 [Emticicia aquatilis]|uniref:Uncharacterized protein n=1 Tax=Emticicia aquatilis TaxID=1537369 RepID=A0A916Z444_9BACT|nr:hypothetical protein GCM10011514_44770 [Emticicia aquatilis]
MTLPIFTAREYPMMSSHFAPVDTLILSITLRFLIIFSVLKSTSYRAIYKMSPQKDSEVGIFCHLVSKFLIGKIIVEICTK